MVSAQSTTPLTTIAALDRYGAGERDVIAQHAPGRLPPIWTIADDLARIPMSIARSAGGARRGGANVPHESQLSDIAAATGGDVTTFRVDDSIPTTFRDILNRFRTSHVLRYTPQGAPPRGWHAVTVHVGTGNYEIRARKGWQG